MTNSLPPTLSASGDSSPPRPRFPLRRLILFSLLLAIILTPWAIREYRLSRIPLIPDPFDFEKFSESYHIPDSENAYVEYHQAVQHLQERQEWRKYLDPENLVGIKWENAPEEVKSALAQNERAIELWLRGTTKPRAVLIPPDQLRIDTSGEIDHKLRE
ncbi:MAG: hypothetical protein KDA68_20645, partial [Planctomycetaceae bacterium]|nr:hypothetical protein [Planctomycetaceae bacterium]